MQVNYAWLDYVVDYVWYMEHIAGASMTAAPSESGVMQSWKKACITQKQVNIRMSIAFISITHYYKYNEEKVNHAGSRIAHPPLPVRRTSRRRQWTCSSRKLIMHIECNVSKWCTAQLYNMVSGALRNCQLCGIAGVSCVVVLVQLKWLKLMHNGKVDYRIMECASSQNWIYSNVM